MHRPARRRRRSTPPRSTGSRSGTTGATRTARSTSSATSTAAATSWRRCSTCSATRPDADGTLRGTPTAARPCSSATWSTAARTRRACCAWSWAWSPRARRSASPATTSRSCSASCSGRNVQITHGLAESLEQLDAEPPEFRERGRRRSSTAWSATTSSTTASSSSRTPGCRQRCRAAAPAAVATFALYGETTGETDEFGLPVRYHWADEYRGRGDGRLRPHAGARAGVAQQHDLHRHRLRLRRLAHRAALPGARARLRAGRARLLRAGQAVPRRAAEAGGAAWRHDELLDIDDVLGKRGIETRLHGTVTIREENAAAALEVMSRFAVDPRWLIYLPPTMSPSATTQRRGLARAPRRGVRRLPARRRATRGLRGEAHGLARGRRRLPRRPTSRARPARGIDGRRHRGDPHRPVLLRRHAVGGTVPRPRARGASSRAGLWSELDTDWPGPRRRADAVVG